MTSALAIIPGCKIGFVTNSKAFIDSLSVLPPHPPEDITPFFKVINLQDESATSGCACIKAYCVSSLFGRQMSSASILAIYSPSANDIALLREDGSLRFCSLVCTFTRASSNSYCRRISAVLSLEQSFIIMSSKSLNVWLRTLSIASFKYS